MSDKLSLEHIIRNIAEGKFPPSDEQKVNLEHTIKNVMKNEAVGVLGTDKYQGNQFKTIKTNTPHITPPGPEHGHSQAPETAARARTIAKEKSSATLNNNMNEAVKVKQAKKTYDFLSGLWRTAEKENLPAVVGKEKEVVGHKANLPAEQPKANLPAEVPAKPPETAPNFPLAKPETDVKSAVKTVVKLNRVTATDAETAAKTATTTHTPVDTETKTKVEPKAVEVNRPAPVQEPETKKVVPPVPPSPPQEPDAKKAAPPKVPKGYIGKGKALPHFYGYDVLHRVPVNRHLSFARPAIKEENERKKIENVPRPDAGDRHVLEYVGRKKKDTLARNASVKNVVNEGKKLANVVKKAVKETQTGDKTKVYDNPPVIINPNLNRIDMNVAEGVVKTTGKLINHAFNGLGAYQAVDSARKGDMTGAAVGAGMLIPNPIGSAVGASSIAGDIATGTETGRKVGKWIGDNVPGAKAAAEKAKELRTKVGLGSTASKPDEDDEVKPLAPGEGIKLQPKKPK